MLIYLFRDEGTRNLALTIDVTGHNLPPVSPSTNWIFIEAIDTLRFPPPWNVADFQCLLRWLSVDGFYFFDAGVKDPKSLPAGWSRLRSHDRSPKGQWRAKSRPCDNLASSKQWEAKDARAAYIAPLRQALIDDNDGYVNVVVSEADYRALSQAHRPGARPASAR